MQNTDIPHFVLIRLTKASIASNKRFIFQKDDIIPKLTLPLPVTVPTKQTGQRSRSATLCSRRLCSVRHNNALFSWYSAPHSSRVLMLGSPRANFLQNITAPAGSTNSFSTLPTKYKNLCESGYFISWVMFVLNQCWFNLLFLLFELCVFLPWPGLERVGYKGHVGYLGVGGGNFLHVNEFRLSFPIK